MNHKEKQVYLAAIKKRYKHSGKQEKARILDEFSQVCGYSPEVCNLFVARANFEA